MSFSSAPTTKQKQVTLDHFLSQDKSKKRKFVEDLPPVPETQSEEESYTPPPVTDFTALPTLRQQQLVPQADKQGKPSLGLPGAWGEHGLQTLAKNPGDPTGFKKGYRVGQKNYIPDMGSAGEDERFSTSNTAKVVVQHKTAPQPDRQRAVRFLSRGRESVTNLGWVQPGEDQPLAAHPGSLSTNPQDMRNGITGGHNTRDAMRANWSLNEAQSSGNPFDPLSLRNASTMASVMTSQLMSQPHAQLTTGTPTPSTEQAYSAKFGELYTNVGTDQVDKTPAYDMAARDIHNNREIRKWQQSEELLRGGFNHLVDPVHLKYLQENGGDWSAAMEAFLKVTPPSQSDKGPPVSQAFIPENTTRKGPTPTLQQWNDEAQKGTMKRSVSQPREFLSMAREQPEKTPKKKAKTEKQQELNFPKSSNG